MHSAITRLSARALAVSALTVAVLIGGGIWLTQRGSLAGAATVVSAKAARGDVIVSVGGVGRIVTNGGASAISVPATSSTSPAAGPSGGTSSSVSADAIFPRTSGHVERFLVLPGQHVTAGQPIAILGDNGASASATRQAQLDVATARLELRQKQRSDPLKGVPATSAELAAAGSSIASARADLALVTGRARPADVSAARLDVRRAEADLQTLRGGPSAARDRAIALATERVAVARKRLDRALAPAKPTDIAAAQAEVKKAESDLAVLQKPPVKPLAEDVAAAQNAVTVAQQALTVAQTAAPPDPAVISAAQLEVSKAVAALATLQRPAATLLPQEIASAQAAVDAARTKLATLQGPPDAADVATVRQELVVAQAELQTLRTGPSTTGLAAARQAVASARAKLAQVLGPPTSAAAAAARLGVKRAQAEVAVLHARGAPASAIDIKLAKLKYSAATARLAASRLSLRQLTVRAPSAGTVTGLLTVRGAPADGFTPIASVADLSRLAVRVELSEFDVASVKNGLPATVSVDALGGKSFPGVVLFAALSGSDSGGVVTFPVTVGLTRVRGPRPGMNVSVRIITAQRHDVVQVPVEAVSRDDEDHPVVSIVDADGKTSPREVTLGLSSNKNVEIVKGLRAGERVALEASSGSEE